jgi:hypothetical protein
MQVVLDSIDVSPDWLIHVSTRRRVTRAEYNAFCAANRDLRIERSAEGELIVMPPAHSRSGNQNARDDHPVVHLGDAKRDRRSV